MAEKRNIFLVGPMGAGKSTIGRQLAQQLNMEFYDSDQEIEKRVSVTEKKKSSMNLRKNRALCWLLAAAL